MRILQRKMKGVFLRSLFIKHRTNDSRLLNSIGILCDLQFKMLAITSIWYTNVASDSFSLQRVLEPIYSTEYLLKVIQGKMSAEPLEPLHPSHIHLAGWNYNEDTERRILAHLYEPQHEEDLLKVWIEFVSSFFLLLWWFTLTEITTKYHPMNKIHINIDDILSFIYIVELVTHRSVSLAKCWN